MARKRTASPTAATPTSETMASLRLHNRTSTDWAFGAEGFLLLYDPSVVTDAVFDELFGLQTIAPAALGWMTGNGNTSLPIVAEPQHWRAHGRTETAAQVSRLVRLGWECSLAMMLLCVASNGADIRFRSSPLSPEEKKTLPRERGRGPVNEPRRAWIVTREPRLAVTWDFMLGFKTAQKQKLFDAGYTAEIAWPAGAYQVSGWSFPEVENDDGVWISQYTLQLEPWIEGREIAQ